METHSEGAEWTTSFKKEATKEEVMIEVSKNGVSKALLRQSLSDICCAKNRTAQNVLFQQLKYQRVIRRFSVTSNMHLTEKREEVAQAQKKLQETVETGEEL